jgi:hypothetical protein
LDRVETARRITSAVRVADLALAILRDSALEPLTARWAIPAAIDIGFAWVQDFVGTQRRRTDQRRARILNAIGITGAALTVRTLLCRGNLSARPATVFAGFLTVSNAVRTIGNLAFSVLAGLALTIR